MRFWDPHFHLWNVSEDSDSGHDATQLFAPQGDPVYSLSRLERDLASRDFELSGGAVVEAVSVCHVDADCPAFSRVCLAEARWIARQLAGASRGYEMVAAAALEGPDIGRILLAHSHLPEVRGVRQILNFEPSWPRNARLGNLLHSPSWRRGYSMLEEHGFSFDLQLNPGQFRDAAELLARHPDTPVMLDHLGCPTLAELRAARTYWEGMAALADLAHVQVKISMLSYVDESWHRNALVTEAVRRVIELFGIDRCSFASNFPVEQQAGWSAGALLAEFRALVSDMDLIDQQKLFADNARNFYLRAAE